MTEKLQRDHVRNIEAIKEELAKVKSAGEEKWFFPKFPLPLLFPLVRCWINAEDGKKIFKNIADYVKEVFKPGRGYWKYIMWRYRGIQKQYIPCTDYSFSMSSPHVSLNFIKTSQTPTATPTGGEEKNEKNPEISGRSGILGFRYNGTGWIGSIFILSFLWCWSWLWS